MRVAHHERPGAGHQPPLELIGDLPHRDEALGRDARLPVVDHPRLDRGAGRGIEVGAGHDDEWIAAAELQHRFLDLPCRRAAHGAARGVAPGQGDRSDPGIFNDALNPLGVDEQRLKAAFGKAGPAEDLFDGQGALRDVGRMLEQSHVARGQRGSGEPEDLPEGEVPRHHGEDRPDRLVDDQAAIGAGLDHFVGQEALGVLGIIAAAPGALHRLVHRRLQGLAHLQHHQLAEPLFLDSRGSRPPSPASGCDRPTACGGSGGRCRPRTGGGPPARHRSAVGRCGRSCR